jgi:PEP-CTERM motif
MKLWNAASAALLAGALSLAGGGAQAGLTLDVEPEVPTVAVQGTTDGTAAPGGTAFTSFSIAFAGTYDFISVDMAMSYDPARLTFNPFLSSVSMSGTTVALPVFLTQLAQMEEAASPSDFTFYAGQKTPGNLFFGAGYTVEGSLPLTGSIVVTTAFDLSPSFEVGTQSLVHIGRLEFTDFNLAFTSLASEQMPVSMAVTAVPEPESWLMLLAGMGLLGAMAKRRTLRA